MPHKLKKSTSDNMCLLLVIGHAINDVVHQIHARIFVHDVFLHFFRKGDCHRYLAEFTTHEEKMRATEGAKASYQASILHLLQTNWFMNKIISCFMIIRCIVT